MEYINFFNRGWHNSTTRPQGIVLEAQYNWTDMYKNCMNKISGFCRTKENDRYARGFRFVHENGCVQLYWKTSATDREWKGEKETQNGFIILRSFPVQAPEEIPPDTAAQATKKQLDQLNSPFFQTYLKTIKKTAELEWLIKAAETGSCPTEGPWDETCVEKRGELGVLEKSCVGGRKMKLRVLRPTIYSSLSEFWKLPPDVLYHLDLSAPVHVDSDPIITYTKRKRRKNEKTVSTDEDAEMDAADTDADTDADTGLESEEKTHDRRRQKKDTADFFYSQEDNEPLPAQYTGKWGAPWENCKIGHFAIVQATYPNEGKGCEIVEILSKDDKSTFEGRLWSCRYAEHDPRWIRFFFFFFFFCLFFLRGKFQATEQKWTYENDSVIAYFEHFKDKRIPEKKQSFLNSYKEDLFVSPK
jgi:hypothetical protein